MGLARVRRQQPIAIALTLAGLVCLVACSHNGVAGPAPSLEQSGATSALSPSSLPSSPAPLPTVTATTACAADPHSCGFPDATNTGYKGVLTGASRRTKITTAGSTIANTTLGCLYITASNVTLTNDLVVGSSPTSFCVRIKRGVSNTVIKDTTIHGTDAATNSIEYAIFDEGRNTRIVRDNLYWCTECIAGSSFDVEDSYIHDLGTITGAHYEDFYIGDANGLVIKHTTAFNQHNQTAAIYMSPDVGDITNVTIEGNLLGGGGFTLYGGGEDPSKPSSHVVVTNNLFSTRLFPDGGEFGMVTGWSPAGNVWTGNVIADGPRAGEPAG
jgi:hypothetical protein